MFATQLKELESRCADIAQICRRLSITLANWYLVTIPIGVLSCICEDQMQDSWC